MRRLVKSAFLFLLISVALTGCYAGKKNMNQLGGLMLLDNTYLSRNKAYYSKHNMKAKKNVKSHHKKLAYKFRVQR